SRVRLAWLRRTDCSVSRSLGYLSNGQLQGKLLSAYEIKPGFPGTPPSGGQSDCCLPSNPAQAKEYDLGPWIAGFKITNLTTSGMAVSETHIISPTLVNEFLGGYARTDPYTIQSDYGRDPATLLGMQNINVNQFATGLPNITVQDFTGLDGGPAFLPVKPINTLEQIGDTISWVKGHHALKFGFRGINDDDDPFAGNDTRGAPNFEDNFTNNALNPSALAGSGMATLLLGYSTSGVRWYLSSPYYLRSRQESAYAEDDWKVSSRLALNLGVRWDRFGSPTEKYNHIANFDPAKDALIYAGVGGTPADVDVQTQDHNFAPRVGFAFEPTANGKTVVRGGFGIYYFPLPITGSGEPGQFPPFTVAQNYSPPAYPTAAQFATIPQINDLFGPPVTSQPLTTAALDALNPAVFGYALANQTPYMEGWNLDVERQISPTLLFQIAYAGSRGIHLETEYNINEVEPGPGTLASRRLIQALSNVSTIDYFSWGSSSNYNALELKLQKNVSHGLEFLADYTWSKSLDYDEPIMGQAQTYTDQDAAYGPSSWDLQNRFVGSWVYMLPFGQGGRFANNGLLSRLVAGWEFDGISTINTGPPFSLTLNSGVNNGAPSWPNRICDGALSNPTASRWFNTACFVAPPEYTFGNSARDLLFGPGTIDFDLAIVKNTRLTERMNLQFRAEAFNAFNTPNFSVEDLNTAIGSPTAGVITGTNLDNREFEFAFKLLF
ncbi:MAG TPA: TonB-dependent receptor, partial [Terriglobia bacterium]|nr:TonB-dependent receptor [Terriglobia bacterium]